MSRHYSKPLGFVGRNICYAVFYEGVYYGHIVGGSATRFLPGRNEFFDIDIRYLNMIVNNIYYHVEPHTKYPLRNFTTAVIKLWVSRMIFDWNEKYGNFVIGFESLVELPRTGETYRRAGWSLVGETIGYTCKRTAGKGTDSWSGKRIWNTEELKPKLVWCLKIKRRKV